MTAKNILYFTRTMDIGGTEKVIMQLCRYFNKRFNNIIVCSSGGVHEAELKQLGIKHYKINDIENKNPTVIVKTILKIYKILKSEDIQIVHTHHRMAAFYAYILCHFINFRFINTSHNIFYDKRLFTHIILKRADVIAVGDNVRKNLENYYGINSSHIKVIYNGISKFNGQYSKIHEIEDYKNKGYFTVGNIGRLSEQKGMDYFLKSIPDVLKDSNKIMFYIIGDGEQKSTLLKLAKELNIDNHVVFMGYRSDVLNIINKLDIVVLSSLWEGLPLTPIEAFSEKTTIVATNIDGTNEIVKNNYNGILVEPRNVKQISEGILKIYKDKRLKAKLEDNAMKTYLDKFKIDKFLKEYEKYYSLED